MVRINSLMGSSKIFLGEVSGLSEIGPSFEGVEIEYDTVLQGKWNDTGSAGYEIYT